MKLGKFSQSVRVWCIRILMSRVEGSRWHACRATVSDDPPSARLLMQPRCVTVMSSRYLMHCIASFATVGRAQVCSQSLWCLLRAASLSCFSSTMECWSSRLQDCLRVCMLCKAGRVRGNVSFMFLHNVLQCSTHGRCYLHIGGLIIMSVRQIVLSAVQGIILFPSGEGGSSSADACLVFWLLNLRV